MKIKNSKSNLVNLQISVTVKLFKLDQNPHFKKLANKNLAR